MSATNYTEIDGVRTLWCDTPGPLTATLAFRVGQADETLTTRGVTHLCEHLALSNFGTVPYQYNGTTGLTITSFVVRGSDEEVRHHLFALCQQLSSGAFLERLEHERRVLSVEGRQRQPGVVGDHLLVRFGARGVGLVAYEELGLHRLSRDDVWNWAARYLTRQNAVLTLSTPPPEGLQLPLLDGAPVNVAPPGPLPIRTPSQMWSEGPAAVSSYVERSRAAVAANAIFSQRVVDTLRHEAGTSYSPWTDYLTLDGSNALMVTAADGNDHNVGRTAWSLWSLLGTFASQGPTAEEVEWYRQMVLRSAEEPFAPLMAISGQYDDLLHKGHFRSVEEMDADLMSLDVAQVRDMAMTMWRSALVSLPSHVDVPTWDLPELTPAGRGAAPETAQRYERQSYVAVDNWSTADALRCSPIAVTLEAGERTVSVSIGPDTSLLAFGDGSRVLIDGTGAELTIRPTAWENGQALVGWLDTTVGTARTIAVGSRRFGPTGTQCEVLRTVRGMDPRSRIGKKPKRGENLYEPDYIGPMRLDLWAVDAELPPGVPNTRRWLPGALILGWLAHRHLLADWVEGCIPVTLSGFRGLEVAVFDLFDAAGGALYSDLATPEAAAFITDLTVPKGDGSNAEFGDILWRLITSAGLGQPGEFWVLTEQHAPAIWSELDAAWAAHTPTWSPELAQRLSPRVAPLPVPPSLAQISG